MSGCPKRIKKPIDRNNNATYDRFREFEELAVGEKAAATLTLADTLRLLYLEFADLSARAADGFEVVGLDDDEGELIEDEPDPPADDPPLPTLDEMAQLIRDAFASARAETEAELANPPAEPDDVPDIFADLRAEADPGLTEAEAQWIENGYSDVNRRPTPPKSATVTCRNCEDQADIMAWIESRVTALEAKHLDEDRWTLTPKGEAAAEEADKMKWSDLPEPPPGAKNYPWPIVLDTQTDDPLAKLDPIAWIETREPATVKMPLSRNTWTTREVLQQSAKAAEPDPPADWPEPPPRSTCEELHRAAKAAYDKWTALQIGPPKPLTTAEAKRQHQIAADRAAAAEVAYRRGQDDEIARLKKVNELK